LRNVNHPANFTKFICFLFAGTVELNANGDTNKPLKPEDVEVPTAEASAIDFTRIITSEGFSYDG